MYLPLQKLHIPAGNLRRAKRAFVFVILGWLLFGLSAVLSWDRVQFGALLMANVGMLVFVALLVPFIMLAVVLTLSPVAIYIYADFHNFPVLTMWWFWLYALLAEGFGIFTFGISEKRYPKRDDTDP